MQRVRASSRERSVGDRLGFSMEWPVAGGTEGVSTAGGRVEWRSTPDGPDGRFGKSAVTQTFEEFLEKGPSVAAPRKVVNLLRAYLSRA